MALLISDESGDLGLKGSRYYIVLTLLLLRDEDAQRVMGVANSSACRHFGHPLRKWNSMKGRDKKDPQRLATFLADFLSRVKDIHLCATAVIMDKGLITPQRSPKLYDDASYRMGWCYGLAFKRIGRFLARTRLSARWIVDDNSEPLKRNLQTYLTEKLPEISGFLRRYGSPEFCSSKEQPILILVDFLAGLTGRCFDSFKQAGMVVPFPFQPVWERLKSIFCPTLPLPTGQPWQWDGLLYWPIEHRDKVQAFLNCP